MSPWNYKTREFISTESYSMERVNVSNSGSQLQIPNHISVVAALSKDHGIFFFNVKNSRKLET